MKQENDNFPEQNDNTPIQRDRDRMVFRAVQSVVGVAILAATILTLWNPRSFFKTPDFGDLFQSATKEQEMRNENSEVFPRVGILAGHWQNTPGNVCRDGRTEHDVNYGIAYQLQILLEGEGYIVDLFPEFDERLFGYEADAMITIYAGSCEDQPLPPSGFRVGSSLTVENLDAVDKLSSCLAESYQSRTGLPFTFEVIDAEHPAYHIFRDISPNTPVVRFEIGALSTDGDLIFNETGLIVAGIADGVTCYFSDEGQGG